jgi:hypothetical protein
LIFNAATGIEDKVLSSNQFNGFHQKVEVQKRLSRLPKIALHPRSDYSSYVLGLQIFPAKQS